MAHHRAIQQPQRSLQRRRPALYGTDPDAGRGTHTYRGCGPSQPDFGGDTCPVPAPAINPGGEHGVFLGSHHCRRPCADHFRDAEDFQVRPSLTHCQCAHSLTSSSTTYLTFGRRCDTFGHTACTSTASGSYPCKTSTSLPASISS